MDYCLRCFCCCRCYLDLQKENKNNGVVPLKIGDIHQYVPFKDIVEEVPGNVYYDSVILKQKLEGRSREKK